MVTRRVKIVSNLDWLTVVLFIVIMFCGWLSICGASFDADMTQLLSFSTRPGKQLVWMFCSLILASCILSITKDFIDKYSYLIYVVALLVLLITIVPMHRYTQPVA